MHDMVSIERLSRDLRSAAATLSDREARFLVDQYYAFQEDRIRAAGRVRAMSKETPREPHAVIDWLEAQSGLLEQQLKAALDRYSAAHPIGQWMRSYKGVGPVISAGYLANIDIARANTAGKLWAYCGLAPGRDRRKRGEKMAFNPALKRLSWILGESFMKVSGESAGFYGRMYRQRKAYEEAKNERGDYADLAKASLEAKRFGADTKARQAYEAGKLPPARINLRAQRWAVKLFLSHLQQVWWKHEFGEEPPAPYVMAFAGHADLIPVPPPDKTDD